MAVILGLAGVYDKNDIKFIPSFGGYVGCLTRNEDDIKARWRERKLKMLMRSKDKLTHIKNKI